MAAIFAHYASVQTTLRVPLPSNKQDLYDSLSDIKLLSLEDCIYLLDNFHLLGVDGVSKTLLRTSFRNVKLWEVESYRTLMSAGNDTSVLRAPFDSCTDLCFGVGSLALSFPGFIELLSRLALLAELGDSPVKAVKGLLHRIDLSAGKVRLMQEQHGNKAAPSPIDAFKY